MNSESTGVTQPVLN